MLHHTPTNRDRGIVSTACTAELLAADRAAAGASAAGLTLRFAGAAATTGAGPGGVPAEGTTKAP